ncbi:hypothetical protein C1H46_003699 [Malus baccata]|uniref:Uncharacterized protein n=1 Tax=Malus baccata TaxID=106549 RepID=A0A540NID1_MALBA|nr:hypothetical protein C1H46_003699 [Malus baccata]
MTVRFDDPRILIRFGALHLSIALFTLLRDTWIVVSGGLKAVTGFGLGLLLLGSKC